MRVRWGVPWLLALVLAGSGFVEADGQIAGLGSIVAEAQPPAVVPFGPGERLEYDVRLGVGGRRGEGYMEIGPVTTIRGEETYPITLAYRGGYLGARVNDRFDSWLTVENLVTLRSIEDTHFSAPFNKRDRYKHFELYPDERIWERRDQGVTGEMPTSEPLDQTSFFFFARSLPLEVGDEYVLPRYYRESGNPVILRVIGRETVDVPAGRFSTVVVEPIIRAGGLFGEGGKARLYFSDDERRLLVMMRSKIPILGSLSLHLRSIQEGKPLVSPDGGE